MRAIDFYYESIEKEKSQFIIKFFDMCGVYVHENHTDIAKDEVNKLLDTIKTYEKIINKTIKPIKHYDYEIKLYLTPSIDNIVEEDEQQSIYIIDNDDDEIDLTSIKKQRCNSLKVLIDKIIKQTDISDNAIFDKLYDGIEKYVNQELETGELELSYIKYKQDSTMLKKIINLIYNRKLITLDDKESMLFLADIYVKHNVLGLMLKNEFPIEEYQEVYLEVVGKYKELINEIKEKLIDCSANEPKNIIVKYAFVRLAYEGDKYAKTNKKALLYSGIDNYIDKMLENKYIENNYKQALSLLSGKIAIEQLGSEKSVNQGMEIIFRSNNFFNEHILLECYKYFVSITIRNSDSYENISQYDLKASSYLLAILKNSPTNKNAWFKLTNLLTEYNKIIENPKINFNNSKNLFEKSITMNRLFPSELYQIIHILKKEVLFGQEKVVIGLNNADKMLSLLENIDSNQLLKLCCVTTNPDELDYLKDYIRNCTGAYNFFKEVTTYCKDIPKFYNKMLKILSHEEEQKEKFKTKTKNIKVKISN